MPGVGYYNLAESSENSSTIKRNPKFSFGSQKRQGVQTKDGPGPFDYYNPNMKINLKRAPVATVPQSARMGSAPISRDKTPPRDLYR